jgi:hypothetical protein
MCSSSGTMPNDPKKDEDQGGSNRKVGPMPEHTPSRIVGVVLENNRSPSPSSQSQQQQQQQQRNQSKMHLFAKWKRTIHKAGRQRKPHILQSEPERIAVKKLLRMLDSAQQKMLETTTQQEQLQQEQRQDPMVPKLLKLLRNARKNQKEIIETHENVTHILQKEHKNEKMELLDVHAKETERWQSQLKDTQKRHDDERLDQTNVLEDEIYRLKRLQEEHQEETINWKVQLKDLTSQHEKETGRWQHQQQDTQKLHHERLDQTQELEGEIYRLKRLQEKHQEESINWKIQQKDLTSQHERELAEREQQLTEANASRQAQTQTGSLKKEIEKLETYRSSEINDLQTLSARPAQHNKELALLQQKLEEAYAKHDRQLTETKELREEIHALKTTKSKTKTSSLETRIMAEVKHMKAENAKAIEQHLKEVLSLEQELSNTQERLKIQVAETQRLQAETATSNNNHAEEVKKWEIENADTVEEVHKLKTRLKKETSSWLETKHLTEVRQIKAENAKAKEKLSSRRELSEAQEGLKSQERETHRLQAEIATLSTNHAQEVKKVESENAKAMEQHTKEKLLLREELSEAQERLGSQVIEAQRLQTEIATVNAGHAEEVKKLEIENAEAVQKSQAKETQRLQTEIAIFSTNHAQEVKKVESVNAKAMEQHTKEKLLLRKELSEAQERLGSQVIEAQRLQTEIATVNAGHAKEVKKLEIENAEAVEQCKKEKLSLRQELSEAQLRVESQAAEPQRLQTDIATLNSNHAEEVKKLESENAEVVEHHHKEQLWLRQELSETQEQLEAEAKTLQKKLAAMESQHATEVNKLEAGHAMIGGEHHKEMLSLRQASNEAEARLGYQVTISQNLQDKIVALKIDHVKDIKQLETDQLTETQQLHDEVAKLRTDHVEEVNELHEQRELLEKAYEAAHSELREMKKQDTEVEEVQSLQNHIRSLESKYLDEKTGWRQQFMKAQQARGSQSSTCAQAEEMEPMVEAAQDVQSSQTPELEAQLRTFQSEFEEEKEQLISKLEESQLELNAAHAQYKALQDEYQEERQFGPCIFNEYNLETDGKGSILEAEEMRGGNTFETSVTSENEGEEASRGVVGEKTGEDQMFPRREGPVRDDGVLNEEVDRLNEDRIALFEDIDHDSNVSPVYLESTSNMEMIGQEMQQESYINYENENLGVDELRTLCQFLEHDRAELARITDEMLGLERGAHILQIEAAVATAQRESMDQLRVVQQNTQRQMKSLYHALCIGCQRRIDAAA